MFSLTDILMHDTNKQIEGAHIYKFATLLHGCPLFPILFDVLMAYFRRVFGTKLKFPNFSLALSISRIFHDFSRLLKIP